MTACFRPKGKWQWQLSVVVLHCTYHVIHLVIAMTEATFTFRVEEDLKESFTTAAKARDRTGAQLLRDFMRDFVKKQQEAADHDLWFRRQVQEGLDSANSGNLVAAADVEAEFAKRREQTRQKLNAKS
jgi:predicted transcriptional regulator